MGMYYNRARYYDVENGRFNAFDDWEGKLRNPTTLNKYLYGNSNPVSNIDPSGNLSVALLISRADAFQKRSIQLNAGSRCYRDDVRNHCLS